MIFRKIFFIQIIKFFCAYLFGIALAIVLSPAEFIFIGRNLFFAYVLLSPVGYVLFVFTPDSVYLREWDFIRVLGYCVALLLPLAGLSRFYGPLKSLKQHASILAGLSIGFVGTYGFYYAVAASV